MVDLIIEAKCQYSLKPESQNQLDNLPTQTADSELQVIMSLFLLTD